MLTFDGQEEESGINENKLLEEYKLTRRMTDSSARFNSLKTTL